MKFYAISGSARQASTNTALLKGLQAIAPDGIDVEVCTVIGDLPVFSPDREGFDTPEGVKVFKDKIAESDGLIIASPEYVRSIPGGLKNAIDWLVSGEQVVGKPIVLAHASHRGEDLLATLRTVLSTVSSNFNAELFFRLALMTETPEQILERVMAPATRQLAEAFLRDFADFCRDCSGDLSGAMRV